jgi:hypothetical protein
MTFSVEPIRQWTVSWCRGRTLNLFAGETKLPEVRETRNDIRPEMPADYHVDALEFVKTWKGKPFHTIILDPPYSYRKSMEMYDGAVQSPFNAIKNGLLKIITEKARVITFGYHSVVMGHNRGFSGVAILLMSHGGAIHDTIAVVEKRIKII